LEGSQELIRSFVESRKGLILDSLKQTPGYRTSRKYADLMDQFIRSLFLSAGFTKRIRDAREDGITVVALGSYGRREFCFGSDVDLMVIHQGRLSPEMNKIIPRAIYPLWDAKLEVGHSIQTVQGCIRLALNDFRVLTSLMDGRFLLGSRSFYRLFEEAFWSRIYRERKSFLKQFLDYQQDRVRKFGSEGYFLEPDIKEGMGGLRDLHFMAWTARIYFKAKRLRQLRRFAAFTYFEFDRLSLSGSFLLKVRNRLHVIAGRKEDQLLLSYQKKLSQSFGYQDGPQTLGSEEFMRDLYLHLNRIRYGHEEFLVKALDIIDPLPVEPTPNRLSPQFQVMKGNIALKEGRLSEKDPLTILRAFDEANRLGLFLGSGFIWEARKFISRQGRALAVLTEARKIFLEIILKPGNPKIIRLALEIGLVTLFIPEFKKIRNQVESGFFHVETVDLHCLRTLETLNDISMGAYDMKWPLFSEIYSFLEHRDWLFLAALLHDIGKGYGGDHSEKGAELIPRILKRLGMEGEALEIVPFLVKHHLLLAHISQHRDLGDEKTSVGVAQIVQDKNLLQMLFLLTVADSLSTGPIARSDWKIILLIELFFKARRILEKGVLASPDATKSIEDNKRFIIDALAPHFAESDILHLMDQVSLRYFLNISSEDMVRHFHLALTMGEKKLSWELLKLTGAQVTKIILCTYDKPGLFGKMVGVFTLHNIKVLASHIFTLKNGLAFDIYEVTNPRDPFREEEIWSKIREDVSLALEDHLPLDDLIQKKGMATVDQWKYGTSQAKKIKINNEISDFFTVIEVSSGARVGLLYELAKEIFSLGLDIRFAKFNSDEEKMTGNFYVRDASGQKIHEEDQLDKIRRGILDVLE
jgi:[protein-PII] uridylyltransferase